MGVEKKVPRSPPTRNRSGKSPSRSRTGRTASPATEERVRRVTEATERARPKGKEITWVYDFFFDSSFWSLFPFGVVLFEQRFCRQSWVVLRLKDSWEGGSKVRVRSTPDTLRCAFFWTRQWRGHIASACTCFILPLSSSNSWVWRGACDSEHSTLLRMFLSSPVMLGAGCQHNGRDTTLKNVLMSHSSFFCRISYGFMNRFVLWWYPNYMMTRDNTKRRARVLARKNRKSATRSFHKAKNKLGKKKTNDF